ncbi:MAG: hypothetical protein V4649_03960 [Bacteroidota bacterium]
MEFIKLNSWKIPVIFLLCIVICAGAFGMALLASKARLSDADAAEGYWYFIAITAGISVAFFSIYFFGGMYYFYRSRKVLHAISALGIFDNGQSRIEYKINKSPLFYNSELLLASVMGYPMIVTTSWVVGDYSDIVCSVCILKFNQTKIESLRFPLRMSPKIAAKIKDDITGFVSAMAEKGYPKGDLAIGIKNVTTFA